MKLPKPFQDTTTWTVGRGTHNDTYERGWNDCLAWVLRNNNGPASISPYHEQLAKAAGGSPACSAERTYVTVVPNG